MVLWLKLRKSRSSPGITASAQHDKNPSQSQIPKGPPETRSALFEIHIRPATAQYQHRFPNPGSHGQTPSSSVAGWSSPVARQAHNLKVAGSNPAPATTNHNPTNRQSASGCPVALFLCAKSVPYIPGTGLLDVPPCPALHQDVDLHLGVF